jgi:2-polyprenyl-3-methyl-5-hydroxy-6-metoxy-1,4-benzoquinol methylase
MYAIADIVPQVLEDVIFKNVYYRYLINNYDEDLEKEFDVIHCWHVVHHVLKKELQPFLILSYVI